MAPPTMPKVSSRELAHTTTGTSALIAAMTEVFEYVQVPT